MLTIQDYNLDTKEEYKQICLIRDWIHTIHETGNFFQLPLKTLELIRRFNVLYAEVFENGDDSPSIFNQLLVATRGLESAFIRHN
ncbi:MAG: hypothetical protein KJO51_01685 [Gramella sp.]|nr:hypothetical protein [Christiangramia sp.]